MVIWLTGLSGAGKTTIGRLVHGQWRLRAPNIVLVDGDEIRAILNTSRPEEDYTLEARRSVAERIVKLCAWLDSQDMHVVCCTISLFADLQKSNRRTFSRYFEVFVDVPLDIAARRDATGLYAAARRGERQNVIGMDLPFEPPAAPDYVVDNSTDRDRLDDIASDILEKALAA